MKFIAPPSTKKIPAAPECYGDGFTPKRFTKFCHRYNFSSLGADDYIVRKEDYRYHHRGNKIDDKD